MRKVIPIAIDKTNTPPADGWERLSTLSEPRLSEMAENYRALGYEVDVRDVQTVAGDGCNSCFDAARELGHVFGTLFVRRRPGTGGDNELFD